MARKRFSARRSPGAQRARQARPAPAPKKSQPTETPAPTPQHRLRVGVIPGATPGKWVDTWQQRFSRAPLELVEVAARDAVQAVREGTVDIAIARLDREASGSPDDLHVIRLYTELAVVVAHRDSFLLAANELALADLEGQGLLPLNDEVIAAADLRHPEWIDTAPLTPEEAIATVAAGVGATVVPMSLARLHQRGDVGYRPLTDGPPLPVGLVWRRDHEPVEVTAFIGVVRGRTSNSSR
ncbi:LysR family transcriptional regulator substrate-binding protein [Microbacterium sp. YY-01]|uniref:LysR family transcriptional regulator substrate-binding protein n=1 Tax=Microbacterium sp. YY-01 TaxID=3421634 RepID=UPI003D17ABBF